MPVKSSNKILSQTVTQLCLLKKIDHIVISPGSRNAPLTIGFTENKSFTCFSIIDERSAAFFALGLAQQLQKPVALVCTSGSALLNYYPAIAEAFYSDIPLVILSADRPKERIDIGDGQTIRQENVFHNHILYSANCKEGPAFKIYNETEINKALNKAILEKGPVHINIPFSEPLYKTGDTLQASPLTIEPEFSEATIDITQLKPFVDIWNTSKRKLVLVGVLKPNSIEQKYLDFLAADSSVVVLTETTSNLHHKNFFPCIDQLIASLDSEGFNALQPDVLLTFGGMVVSKKIKSFLRNYAPKYHWHIDEKKAYDTYFVLSRHFKVSANNFLSQFLKNVKNNNSDYKPYWSAIKLHRLKQHNAYLDIIPFCDFKVFDAILPAIPDNYLVHISNSSAIRYTQLFELNKSLQIYCNRGTSGIDGCTSTAIGASYISSTPTVLITGDLSFLYDSNGLWNNYIKNTFRIILINNGGGGIFRILPGDKNTNNFDTYFETRHNLNAKYLSEMYGFEYASVNKEDDLNKALKLFYNLSEKPKLLEIFTPTKMNDKTLLDYFNFIK